MITLIVFSLPITINLKRYFFFSQLPANPAIQESIAQKPPGVKPGVKFGAVKWRFLA
jgi:hypothetical protein